MSVRVYLPATTGTLRELVDARLLAASVEAPLTGFAITAGLRQWYTDGDDEALEYAALSEAARASLRLIDADPAAASRRVVVAADIPDASVEVRDDLERGVVRIAADVPLARVASVHVDDPDAADTVRRAARSIVAADLGEPSAQDAVDDAEGFELSWYASQELDALLELL